MSALWRADARAAYQEIEALKSRLRELSGGAPDRNTQEQLQDHLEQYKTYAKQLEQHIATLEQENNMMRSPSSTARSGLLMLYDNNRNLPQPSLITSRERWGSLPLLQEHRNAPRRARDPSLEMVYSMSVMGEDIAGVIYPKCLWTGYKKRR